MRDSVNIKTIKTSESFQVNAAVMISENAVRKKTSESF